MFVIFSRGQGTVIERGGRGGGRRQGVRGGGRGSATESVRGGRGGGGGVQRYVALFFIIDKI
jgi:hypothetical protein